MTLGFLSAVLGLAAALLLFGIWGLRRAAALEAQGLAPADGGAQAGLHVLEPYVRVVAPVFERLAAKGAADARAASPLRAALEGLLQRAGRSEAQSVSELQATIVVGAIAGALAGGLFYLALKNAAIIAILAVLGAALPLLSLSDLARRRQREIRRGLPFVLDLLTLAVEAGLDFTAAMDRIAERLSGGAITAEFGLLLRELRMGLSRKEALGRLAQRTALPEMKTIVTALVQADELGTGIGHTLRIQSEAMRLRRFQRAEKQALQAPVKMLLPLVGFIFPTVFIVLFGPMVLKIFL